MTRNVQNYGANDLAGCVEQRRNRMTGFRVGVYHAAQAGMEMDPATPWATVCEEHNSICVHGSLVLARSHAADPRGWCEACRRGYLWDRVTARYVRLMADVGREASKASEAEFCLFTKPGDKSAATCIDHDAMPDLIERFGELNHRKDFLEFLTQTYEDMERSL